MSEKNIEQKWNHLRKCHPSGLAASPLPQKVWMKCDCSLTLSEAATGSHTSFTLSEVVAGTHTSLPLSGVVAGTHTSLPLSEAAAGDLERRGGGWQLGRVVGN